MSLEAHYPSTCPFCRISKAYPPNTHPVPLSPDPELLSPQCHLLLSTPLVLAFFDIMPISPGHVLLITREHFEKLSDIPHAEDIGQDKHRGLWARSAEGSTPAQALGFWMPLLSRALAKTLDIEDWNVVQNNGARAAQVVPHVHYHFIPRYPEGRKELGGKGKVDVGMLKSWRMFGRGTREELDDDEAVELSARIRKGLEKEVEALSKTTAKL